MALTAHIVTIDCADPAGLAKFWTEAAGYELRWQQESSFLMLAPASGEGVRIGLQRVAEAKPGKNRAHIDWKADDRRAEVIRLVELGASVLDEQVEPGLAWTVLADPEGNEFCVFAHE